VEAILEQADTLNKEYSEEIHTDFFQRWWKKSQEVHDQLVVQKNARIKLADAVSKQEVQDLEEAIAKCKSVGIPESEQDILDAIKLLERVKYEEKIMNDLESALEKKDPNDICNNICLASKITMTSERITKIKQAKDTTKNIYLKLCQNCLKKKNTAQFQELYITIKNISKKNEWMREVKKEATLLHNKLYEILCKEALQECNDKKLQNELIPKIKELGLKNAMVTANNCLKNTYLLLCKNALQNKDDKKVELYCIPHLAALGFKDIEKKSRECLAEIYKLQLQDADQSNNDNQIQLLIEKITEHKYEELRIQADSHLKKVYNFLINNAKTTNDIDKLEDNLIPKILKMGDNYSDLIEKANSAIETICNRLI